MSFLTKAFHFGVRASRASRSFSSVPALRDVNSVIFVGRVCEDPDVRQISEDRSMVTYTLETSDDKTDKEGNRVKVTQWHNIASYEEEMNSFIAQNFRKDAIVYVEGAIKYDIYRGESGETKSTTEIIQQRAKLLMGLSQVNNESVPDRFEQFSGFEA